MSYQGLCSSCRFVSIQVAQVGKPGEPDELIYRCKFNPPTVVYNAFWKEVSYKFPIVDHNEWCGQHKFSSSAKVND